jgi:hypothetical protein
VFAFFNFSVARAKLFLTLRNIKYCTIGIVQDKDCLEGILKYADGDSKPIDQSPAKFYLTDVASLTFPMLNRVEK